MQILSTPIVFDKYLLGVLQLINKHGGGSFSPRDEAAAEELAKILGIAFYNQHRSARTNEAVASSARCIDKGLISEKDLDKAIETARINQLDVAKVLIEEARHPQGGGARRARGVLQVPRLGAHGATMPADLKQRVSADIWKKYVCARRSSARPGRVRSSPSTTRTT